MFWGRCVTILVPLLLLNVLAAEAFIGNSRSWNSRELNFRKPVDSRPNPVTHPIHSLPRPLPRPVHIRRESISEPEVREIAPEESLPVTPVYGHRTGRYSQPRTGRFNLPRRPIAAPRPAPISHQPIAIAPPPAPVTPVPEPVTSEATVAPEDLEISPELIVPVSPSTEEIVPSSTPVEDPISAEDIQVFRYRSLPVSSPRPPLRRYSMARPLPRPTSTVAPIRSVTVMEPEREEGVELSLPSSPLPETSSVTPIRSSPREIPTTVRISTTSMAPQYIHPDIDEPEGLEILDDEESESVVSEMPVEVSTVQPEVIEYTLAPISGGRSLRTRRPLPRKPVARSVTPKPSVPIVTPSSRTIYRPKPHAKPLIPSRVKPVPVKPSPVPTVMPAPLIIPSTQPPTQGRSLIPSARVTIPSARAIIPEPSVIMDYVCDQENVYNELPNDCDSYVECKSFVPMMNTCPDGLHFNRRAVWPDYPCGYPSEVQCESNAYRHDPQPTEQCPRQYGLFPMADSDCSRYLMCQEGISTVMDCPPGLVFNSDLSACDWPANVPSCNPEVFRGFTCPAPPLEENGSPSDMIFKYRFGQSCKEYIACQLGHPRLLSCDAGLSFDEESQVCVDSQYVQNCLA